jgi:uncharacterized protein
MSLPVPAAQFEDRPFWVGGEHGRLNLARCGSCHQWLHPPRPICRHCRSTDVRTEQVSGRATVFTFTVNHQPWNRNLPVPYVLAIVAIEEDPRVHLTTRLVDVDPADVSIGMAVEVRFQQHDDVWLPLFAPRVAP